MRLPRIYLPVCPHMWGLGVSLKPDARAQLHLLFSGIFVSVAILVGHGHDIRSRILVSGFIPEFPGSARPQVADRGDGLQIWRVAANILNKQSQTADKA
jgi:hypothetical protein